MIVHIFQPEQDKKIGGFTEDKTGSNLPSKFGKWIYKNTIDFKKDSPLMGADSKVIIQGIQSQGYSVQEAMITTKELYTLVESNSAINL
jgi:hypothetical protein